MSRRSLLLLPCLALLAAGALSPAQASPKPFSRTVPFVDRTPDPTAFFLGPEHCMGRLPAESPVTVDIPAAGSVNISISGFYGEWSLMVTNEKGAVVGTADADAPATEKMTLRMKKAGRIKILPCNIAGTFDASLTYAWAPKR